MKNRLIDLNNHMFDQLERLLDEDLDGEALEKEITRSKAVTHVAAHIIENANLALKAAKVIGDGFIRNPPEMLGMKGPDEEE